MEHPEPWHVVWRCGCDDAQPDRSSLPERCPGHDAERIDPPHVLWRQTSDRALVECGHACGDRPCPTGGELT